LLQSIIIVIMSETKVGQKREAGLRRTTYVHHGETLSHHHAHKVAPFSLGLLVYERLLLCSHRLDLDLCLGQSGSHRLNLDLCLGQSGSPERQPWPERQPRNPLPAAMGIKVL
jgi:hypothetical protein